MNYQDFKKGHLYRKLEGVFTDKEWECIQEDTSTRYPLLKIVGGKTDYLVTSANEYLFEPLLNTYVQGERITNIYDTSDGHEYYFICSLPNNRVIISVDNPPINTTYVSETLLMHQTEIKKYAKKVMKLTKWQIADKLDMNVNDFEIVEE